MQDEKNKLKQLELINLKLEREKMEKEKNEKLDVSNDSENVEVWQNFLKKKRKIKALTHANL